MAFDLSLSSSLQRGLWRQRDPFNRSEASCATEQLSGLGELAVPPFLLLNFVAFPG